MIYIEKHSLDELTGGWVPFILEKRSSSDIFDFME